MCVVFVSVFFFSFISHHLFCPSQLFSCMMWLLLLRYRFSIYKTIINFASDFAALFDIHLSPFGRRFN